MRIDASPQPDRGPDVTRAAGHADVRQRAARRGHRRGARHARARTTSARRSSSSARTSSGPAPAPCWSAPSPRATGSATTRCTTTCSSAITTIPGCPSARSGEAQRAARRPRPPRPPVPALRRWRRAGAAAAQPDLVRYLVAGALHAGAVELRPARLGAAARVGRALPGGGRRRRTGRWSCCTTTTPPRCGTWASSSCVSATRASRSSRISPARASRSTGAWCAGSSTHSWQPRREEVDDDAGGDLGGRADPPRRAPGHDRHRHLHRGRDRGRRGRRADHAGHRRPARPAAVLRLAALPHAGRRVARHLRQDALRLDVDGRRVVRRVLQFAKWAIEDGLCHERARRRGREAAHRAPQRLRDDGLGRGAQPGLGVSVLPRRSRPTTGCSPSATCTSTACERDALAQVAVATREHASCNPNATMRTR